MSESVRPGAARRWMVVAAGVLVLCMLPAIVAWWPRAQVRANPPTLRDIILASTSQPFQGYVDSRGQIGLPPLPQLGDVSNLFGGTTNTRVWYAGADAWRIAVVDPTGERDIYRTPSGTYVWDFQRNLVTEIVGDLPVRLPWAADVMPPELGRRLLRSAGENDVITPLPSRRIAGIQAAGLRVSPVNQHTTVRRIDIWADPRTGLPLQVEVGARGRGRGGNGTGGVFTTRFLEVAQRTPPAKVIAPVAASTAQFTSTREPDVAAAINSAVVGALPPTLAGLPRSQINGVGGIASYGEGLSRFVVVPLNNRLGGQSLDALRGAGGFPVSVSGGTGYLAQASVLTTVVVRRDGNRNTRRTYLLAGLVRPEVLNGAAAELVANR